MDKDLYVKFKTSNGKINNSGPSRKRLIEEIEEAKKNFNKEIEEETQITLNKDWPEEAFSISKVVSNLPITVGGNSAFFLSKEGSRNLALLNVVQGNLPEIEELTSEGVVKEGFQHIEKAIKINSEQLKISYCCLAEAEDLKSIKDSLMKIKEMIENKEPKPDLLRKSNNLQIAAASGINIQLIRKVVEIVFARTELEITILLPPKSNLNKIGSTKNPF